MYGQTNIDGWTQKYLPLFLVWVWQYL